MHSPGGDEAAATPEPHIHGTIGRMGNLTASGPLGHALDSLSIRPAMAMDIRFAANHSRVSSLGRCHVSVF